MNRRTYLALTGTMLTSAVAGCTTSGGTTNSTSPGSSDPPTTDSVMVSARDATETDPDASYDVTYAAGVASRIPTDPPTLAEDNYKWVVVRMDVTNTGDTERDLTAHQYVLRAGGDVYDYTVVRESWALEAQTAAPGETVAGWVVYHVPSVVREAEVRVRENARQDYAVSFEHDSGLDVTIPA